MPRTDRLTQSKLCRHRLAIVFAALPTGICAPAAAQGDATGCTFAEAIYRPVDQEGEAAGARLEFRETSETVVGLSALMILGSGKTIDIQFSFSNGFVTYYAILYFGGDFEATTGIEAFTSDMRAVRIRPDETAPGYVIFPRVDLEAYMAQRGRPEAETLAPPSGAWRFAECRSKGRRIGRAGTNGG